MKTSYLRCNICSKQYSDYYKYCPDCDQMFSLGKTGAGKTTMSAQTLRRYRQSMIAKAEAIKAKKDGIELEPKQHQKSYIQWNKDGSMK